MRLERPRNPDPDRLYALLYASHRQTQPLRPSVYRFEVAKVRRRDAAARRKRAIPLLAGKGSGGERRQHRVPVDDGAVEYGQQISTLPYPVQILPLKRAEVWPLRLQPLDQSERAWSRRVPAVVL